MSDYSRAHLIIEGRVQGVFYRAFAREVAVSLRLKGWVRNLPDGKVEAMLEGNRTDIESAVSKCYKGPSASSVSGIDVTWSDYKGEFDTFEIKY